MRHALVALLVFGFVLAAAAAPYLGDFPEDATVHFIWDSVDSAGASVTRVVNGTVSVYKANGLTQSVVGITDTEDFDALTGIHACTIDTSADVFYAVANNYTVVLSAATIDGAVVNAVLAHFSIENRYGNINEIEGVDATTALDTAADTVTVTAMGAGVITATVMATDSITSDEVAATAVTEIQSGLSTVTTAQVNAEVDTALADYDGPTNAEMEARTLLAASYFDPALDTVALVTTVSTLTGHTPQTGDTFTLANGVNGFVAIKADTAAILVDTATTIPGLIAALVGSISDAVWDELLTGATHNIPSSAGRRLRDLGAVSILSGTATAGDVQTITLDGDASTTVDIYVEDLIVLTNGTGAGQARMILDYTAGRVVTVDHPWVVTPAVDSEYQIMSFSGVLLTNRGIATAGGASSITLDSSAVATEDRYIGSTIYLCGGTGIGQVRLISDYTALRVATVSPPWDTQPDATTVYKILPVGRSIVDSNEDKTGYSLAADAITASVFDETTAFPVVAVDSGATQIARVGADGDTLETLSDQLDLLGAVTLVEIDEDTGGVGTLRYVDALGAGIEDATVTVMITTDYHNNLREAIGRTTTDASGNWVSTVWVRSGFQYTVEFYKRGYFGPDYQDVTAP